MFGSESRAVHQTSLRLSFIFSLIKLMISSGRMPTAKHPHQPARGQARTLLLAQAQAALRENTFDGEPLSAFATRAGVSQPLFHYHFSSREDLWQSAVAEAFAPLESAFEIGLVELKGLSPVQQLEMLMRRFVHFSAQHPVVAAVILTESMRAGPRLRWLVDHHLSPLHRLVDTVLAAGVEAGLFRPVPAVHVTQAFVFAAAGFFACSPLVEQLYDCAPSVLSKEHADAVVTLFLSGLCAKAKPAKGRERRRR